MENIEIRRETPNEQEDDNNQNDLSSPNPCQLKNEVAKKKIFGITYLDNYFLFVLSNSLDKYLSLELIPVEGNLPYSYKVTYNMQILNSIEYLFKDLKTIDECMKRIISILQKKRISLFRDSENDLFYMVLKITIIDEDKYIPFKLSCTNSIQTCTIRYIYREITGLKENYNEYKKVKLEQIEKQKNEINKLKEINKKYLKLMQKIKNRNDKEYQNKIRLLNNKLASLEQNLIYHKYKFKCDVINHHRIIILNKKDIQIEFESQFVIKNIGNSFLSTKYDKIYLKKDLNLSSKEIDLDNKNGSEIKLKGIIKSNDFFEINLHFIINKPISEYIYNFYANIFSIKHGLISTKPLIIQTLIIPENIKEIDFLKYLKNNFEINLKENNIYYFDNTKKFKIINNKEENNYLINENAEEKEDSFYNKYTNKCEEKIKNYNNFNIYEELKEFLVNNKDVKMNENLLKNIVEKLNKEYLASFWLEHKQMFKIIINNNGNYEQISKEIENLL